MKNFRNAMIILISALMLLAGCEMGNDEAVTGTLRVCVANASVRGIDGVDMETSYYKVAVRNEAKNMDYAEEIRYGKTSVNMFVAAGDVTVTVTAYNKDGQAIGTGSSTAKVKANSTVSCPVTVSEKAGKGNLVLSISTTADIALSAKVFGAADDPDTATAKAEIALTELNDVFTGNGSFDNGFYQVVLYADGKALDAPVSVRIVAGYDTNLTVAIDDAWHLSIKITNTIVKTPSIVLSSDYVSYLPGENYTVTAVVEGMTAPSFRWYMDNERIAGAAGNVLSGVMPGSDVLWYGEHTITVVAAEGDKVWSEEASFTLLDPAERLQEMLVPAGKLEIAVLGDVLIPRAGSVKCLMDGQHWTTFRYNYLSGSMDIPYDMTLSCVLEGLPGYKYYLRQVKAVDKTVIYVMIDKDIQNAAYINMSVNLDYQVGAKTNGIRLYSNDVTFPGNESWEQHNGIVNFRDEIKEITLKVNPGTYSYQGAHVNGPSALNAEMNPRRVSVAAGETVHVDVTSMPYATVKTTLAGVAQGEWFSIYDDGNYPVSSIDDAEGEVLTFYAPVEKSSRLFIFGCNEGRISMYESDAVDLHEGMNEVAFRKMEPQYINTGINVTAGETVSIVYDVKAVFPVASDIYIGVDTFDFAQFPNQNEVRVGFDESGEVRILPLFLDGYEYSFAESVDEAGNKVITVTVDMAPDKAVAVTLNWDVQYDPVKHININPFIVDEVTGKDYGLYLKDGPTTLNFPEGRFFSQGSSNMWRNSSDVVEYLETKERNFTITKGQQNSLTIMARPKY